MGAIRPHFGQVMMILDTKSHRLLQARQQAEHRPAQGNRAMLAELHEGADAASPFDRPRDALGQPPPPGNDVSIPGVDNDVDFLIEQVALNDGDGHDSRLLYC